MPILNHQGVGYYYQDQGQGLLVILAHADASTSAQWKTVVERLDGSFRLLAFDLSGQGKSSPWPDDDTYSLASESTVIQALADLGDGTVHLVGHSAGGSVALEAALTLGERLASLTLVEPVVFHLLRQQGAGEAWAEIEAVSGQFRTRVQAGDHDGAMSGFLDYWGGPGTWMLFPENLRAVMAGSAGKILMEFESCFALTHQLEVYAQLSIPTLLIRGTRTKHSATYVVDLLAGVMPLVEVADIEGAGHMSPVTHKDQVADRIASHLMQFR